MVASTIPTPLVAVTEPKHLGDMTEDDLHALLELELRKALTPLIPQPPVLKGEAVHVFKNQTVPLLSDKRIPMQGYNALYVEVIVYGTAPSGILTVKGNEDGGAVWKTLPTAGAVQTVTGDMTFEVPVGCAFATLELSAIGGAGTAFTVIAQPFVAGLAGTVQALLAAGTATIGNVGRAASTVSPADYTTTDTFANVPGSVLDTLNSQCVSYTVKNTGATNTISYQVLGGNLSDLSDAQVVQVSADLAPAAVGSYSATVAVWRYYAVQAKSKVAASPSTVQVRGIAKG